MSCSTEADVAPRKYIPDKGSDNHRLAGCGGGSPAKRLCRLGGWKLCGTQCSGSRAGHRQACELRVAVQGILLLMLVGRQLLSGCASSRAGLVGVQLQAAAAGSST